MSTSDRNQESTRIIWDYAWLLPGALTILLVAMLCFLYTQRTDDSKWLAHLVESLQAYAFDKIKVFTNTDYQQGVRIRGLFSYGLVVVCYLGASLVALVVGLCTIRSFSNRRNW